MAETVQKIVRLVVGDESSSKTYSATGGMMERATLSIPAAKVGSLSTRTDDNTGVATMNSGHGFATSDKLDVYWSGGSRRGMTATVATDAVTIDGGSGDILPAQGTALTVMKPVERAVDLDGDEAVAVAVYGAQGGYIAFLDSLDADIAVYGRLSAGEGDGWVDGDGGTNPLAGETVAKVTFSHGYSGGAAEMRIRVPYGSA